MGAASHVIWKKKVAFEVQSGSGLQHSSLRLKWGKILVKKKKKTQDQLIEPRM